MQFTAPMAMINLDGNLDDWQCAPIKAQTPFYPFNKEGGIGPAGATFAEGTHCCGDELTMFDASRGIKVAFNKLTAFRNKVSARSWVAPVVI